MFRRLGTLSAIAVAPLLLAAGCNFRDHNVYDLTPAAAYDRLLAAPIARGPKGIFGLAEIVTDGDRPREVRWYGYSVRGEPECVAEITPESPDKSRLMLHCNATDSGPIGGMGAAFTRAAMIEHVDAVLTSRPYNSSWARGHTAARWPSDAKQPDGSYKSAIAQTLKTDRQIIAEVRAAEAARALAEAEKPPPPLPTPHSPADFSKPMVEARRPE